MKRANGRVRVLRLFAGLAIPTALLLSAAGCGGGGGGSAAASEAPTTVFGRQARDLAVGVAAQRRGQKVDVRTTVLAQDGTPRRGLQVALASGGGWVPADSCGPGRYCGEVGVQGSQPRIRVRLTRPSGRASTVAVTLPRRPEPARAAALVHTMGSAFRALRSVIVDERLGSGPPYPPLVTQ